MRAWKGANIWRFFNIRPADLIVNQFIGEMCWSSIPARLPGGATESEGLARSFWKRVVWTARLSGQEKEGATLSETFAPAEELQALTVCFCPPWTCDCIALFQMFKRQTAFWDVEMRSERLAQSLRFKNHALIVLLTYCDCQFQHY